MPSYPELRVTAREVSRRIRQDENSPYRVRRKTSGTKDSRGQSNAPAQYEYRTMSNMLTQPLGRTEFNRLDQGLKIRKPRFIAMVPAVGILFQSNDELVDEGEEVEYMSEWYEVQQINNWDQLLHAIMVRVE